MAKFINELGGHDGSASSVHAVYVTVHAHVLHEPRQLIPLILVDLKVGVASHG